MAKALLAGNACGEAGCKVFRAKNGLWVMQQSSVTIATWHPALRRMQLGIRSMTDETTIDRLNAITAVWKGELWFTVKNQRHMAFGGSMPITGLFRGRSEISGATVYTITEISG